jgi:hypothetical protein
VASIPASGGGLRWSGWTRRCEGRRGRQWWLWLEDILGRRGIHAGEALGGLKLRQSGGKMGKGAGTGSGVWKWRKGGGGGFGGAEAVGTCNGRSHGSRAGELKGNATWIGGPRPQCRAAALNSFQN